MRHDPDAGHPAAIGAAPIRLANAGEVVAGLPALFGFRPRESLMFLSLDRTQGRVGLCARVDLPDPADLPAAVEQLVRAALSNRVAAVVVLAHSGDQQSSESSLRCLEGLFRSHHIEVLDVIHLDDRRYRSLLCDAQDCCPPEGLPYDCSTSRLVAEAVGAGHAMVADRDQLALEFAEPDVEVARRMSREYDGVRSRLRAEHRVDPALPGAQLELPVLRAGATTVKHLLGEALCRGSATLDDEAVATIGVWCCNITVRDVAWSLMDAGDPRLHLAVWSSIARRTIAPFEPAVLCLAAFCAWRSGDGARAWCALERALAADRDYSMAQLVESVLIQAVSPAKWKPVSEAAVWSATRSW